MAIKMIKISIIIPVYNVEKYLRQCIECVINQTYKNLEIILVDDGSPDDCPRICDNYGLIDNRIKVIHKENGGLSDARNAGIQMATGQYGFFVDSDDYLLDTRAIERLVDRLIKTRVEVLSFPYISENEETGKRTIKFQIMDDMPMNLSTKKKQVDFMFKNGVYIASACNKIIRMDLLKRLPFEKGKVSEDIVWCANLLNVASSFDYINNSFYCYRQRSKSITHSISTKNCIDLKDAIIACYRIMQDCEKELKPYLGYYTAYQYSTFIAVQSFAGSFSLECIRELYGYMDVLEYNDFSSKVKLMYLGVRLMGLKNWCRLIRLTKNIWNSRRDII